MNYSLGSSEAVQRLNLGCQLAHTLSDQAREKVDCGDIDSALELLTAAHQVEPRYLEKREPDERAPSWHPGANHKRTFHRNDGHSSAGVRMASPGQVFPFRDLVSSAARRCIRTIALSPVQRGLVLEFRYRTF